MAWISHVDPKDKMLLLVSGGGATSMEDLQFAAGLAANQTFAAGALVCYNHERKIQAGLEYPTSMGLFAINGSTDYDASQYGYNLLKDVEGGGQGTVNTLVASGGFEIQTTEYNDSDFETTAYTPGSCPLTNDTVTLGYVEPSPDAYSTLPQVGCVSVGVITDRKGINRARLRLGQKKLLRFWTCYIPPVNTGS